MNIRYQRELLDPFLTDKGARACTSSQWQEHRATLAKTVVDLQYGGLPPVPEATTYEQLHCQSKKASDAIVRHRVTLRVTAQTDPPFSFLMTLYIPSDEPALPVVLYGDGCWVYLTDEIVADVMRRGFILAVFNRVELASDPYHPRRESGLYPIFPDMKFGALSAWAWGHHRCLDVLEQYPHADAKRVAVVGHSRGGKTTLLAGATDERIAFVSANNSGTGGASSYHYTTRDAELLKEILEVVGYWFGPEMPQYIGRETELPFDQHFLTSLIAPRPLLITDALGDYRCNLPGSWQVHLATREVYRLLGHPELATIHYREGEHRHDPADWSVFLDAAQAYFMGTESPILNADPFKHLEPAFSWRAPQ